MASQKCFISVNEAETRIGTSYTPCFAKLKDKELKYDAEYTLENGSLSFNSWTPK